MTVAVEMADEMMGGDGDISIRLESWPGVLQMVVWLEPYRNFKVPLDMPTAKTESQLPINDCSVLLHLLRTQILKVLAIIR